MVVDKTIVDDAIFIKAEWQTIGANDSSINYTKRKALLFYLLVKKKSVLLFMLIFLFFFSFFFKSSHKWGVSAGLNREGTSKLCAVSTFKIMMSINQCL